MRAHLWRKMPAAPHLRFACTIEEDTTTTDGFRVVDNDPSTATPDFMHEVQIHMTLPVNVAQGFRDQDGHFTGVREARPKEPGHFDAAVRSIPNALLSAVGRS